MQQGLVNQAERAYDSHYAAMSDVYAKRCQNLVSAALARRPSTWMVRMANASKESFEANQWRGDPLNGQTSPFGTTLAWEMPFSLCATPALVAAREKVRFAVAASQIALFREHLAWPLSEVVDRKNCSHAEGGPHIP